MRLKVLLSLRDLLAGPVNRTLDALDERGEFSLRRWAAGDWIASIAREMRLAWRYLGGHFRPRVVALVAKEFMHAFRRHWRSRKVTEDLLRIGLNKLG